MPELPEVETIARGLASGADNLLGRTVARAHASWQRTVASPSASEFELRIVGQQVKSINRRGKFVQIQLDRDALLIHLRMSGDLLTGYQQEPLGSHSRLQIWFADGLQLSFQDPRKFGRIWLVADHTEVIGLLGPEPLAAGLTPARFHKLLADCRRQLKPLLLDQTFLAGIGNIYADEALWEAKLHPLSLASRVSREKAGALLRGIRKVLKAGIRRNGASIDWVYRGGEYQNHFKVYQRTGEPCSRCGAKIKRIVLGQRSTHFCPRCQRKG